MAVASKPMAMQPTIARQNGRASGYIVRCLPPHLRFLRRKQPRMQFLAWPGTVLIPISQGTEVMIVTEYVLFSIFHLYCKYGNQFNHAVLWRGTTRNQDSHRIRPRGANRIYQAQGVSLEGHQWTDQAKEGLEQCWSSEPERLQLKQKELWPARRGHPGCKTLQMWTAKASQPPHKCLKWTPRWTMPKTRRYLWWNGLWIRWGTATPRRSMLMW